MTRVDDCRCDELTHLVGEAASPYARDHLLLETVAPDALSATWACPATGWRWCETYYSAWRPDEPAARLDRLHRVSQQPRRRARRPRLRAAVVVAAVGLGLTALLEFAVL